jgi:predicted XRE-type DNA-binding protein
LFFFDIDEPRPAEIREWMHSNNLSIKSASEILGISQRQFSRILSGESKAKRIHSLAMQMIWLINENKKKVGEDILKKNKKRVKIPIR